MKFLAALAFLFVSSVATAQQPDYILYNGKVFTSDSKQLYVEALAISKNKIIATGTSRDILKLSREGTKSIDLQGKTVVPGFNDAHYHHTPIYKGRYIRFSADGTASPARKLLEDSITKAVMDVPKGTWIHASLGPGTKCNTSTQDITDRYPVEVVKHAGDCGNFC